MPLQWEKLASSDIGTWRAKVPGGWLVLVRSRQRDVTERAPVTFWRVLWWVFLALVLIWVGWGFVFLGLFNFFNKQPQLEPRVAFSEFITAVQRGEVGEVNIRGRIIHVKYSGGNSARTWAPDDPSLVSLLREKGVRIEAEPEEGDPWYVAVLVQWFPAIIGLLLIFIGLRRLRAGRLAVTFYPDPTYSWDGSSLQ